MAIVTFQQIYTNFSQGAVTISFYPATGPNPIWSSFGELVANQPVDLGGIQRSFNSPGVVTLSVQLPTGMRVNQSNQILPTPGPRSLVFPILRSNYVLICNVS